MAYVQSTIDEAVPPNNESISQGATRIRNLAQAIEERIRSFYIDPDVDPMVPKNGAIPGAALVSGSITDTQLAAASVTNAKLGAASVATANLQDGSVIAAKQGIVGAVRSLIAPFSLAPSTPTFVTLNAPAGGIDEVHQGGTLWSAGNPTRLTCPLTGVYNISYTIGQVTSTVPASSHSCAIRVSGLLVVKNVTLPAVGFSNAQVSILLKLTAGDYVEFSLTNSHSGALNFQGSAEMFFVST